MQDYVIDIRGETLPEVWEQAVVECWENGQEFETQYDKPGDPKSKDCTAIMVVNNPLAEPRIHFGMPTGIEDLEIYRQEVVYGVHNHWIGENRWNYSYHDRLFNYMAQEKYFDLKEFPNLCLDFNGIPFDTSDYPTVEQKKYNQIQDTINILAKTPFTRRAQVITWQPWIDLFSTEPPCLQRLWLRIFTDENNNKSLIMNVDMRSNDAFKAAYMNMFAFIELQAYITNEVSKIRDEEIKVGRYLQKSDSFHIYGSDFEKFNGFLSLCKSSAKEKRIFNSQDFKEYFDSGRIKLFNNIQTPDIPMPVEQLRRLYSEIPEERREELDKEQIKLMGELE